MSKKAELVWPQFEVIEVEDKLGPKALVPGNPQQAIARATRRAEAAVDQLSIRFPVWMREESDRLYEIRAELDRLGPGEERLDRLFTCAHDIKGQALTYGYPAAAAVARLLCNLIEKSPDPAMIPLPVIHQHVDTIRAIVRQDLKGEGNAQTSNIIQGLHVLGVATLKRMTGQQPQPPAQ